jgi:hypothetical protein
VPRVTASITRSRLKPPGFWRGGKSRKPCNRGATKTPVGVSALRVVEQALAVPMKRFLRPDVRLQFHRHAQSGRLNIQYATGMSAISSAA